MKKEAVQKMVWAGVCLALSMVLPFLTGQIRTIGKMLCPMHIPVLLAGFLCGPLWALVVGAIAPLLRFALFGMPAIFPTGLSMSFELLTYGVVAGLLYTKLEKTTANIYLSLIVAMLAGRAVWGIVMATISGIAGTAFSWIAFLTGAFTNAIPGIIVQIVLIPIIVLALQKEKIIE